MDIYIIGCVIAFIMTVYVHWRTINLPHAHIEILCVATLFSWLTVIALIIGMFKYKEDVESLEDEIEEEHRLTDRTNNNE